MAKPGPTFTGKWISSASALNNDRGDSRCKTHLFARLKLDRGNAGGVALEN